METPIYPAARWNNGAALLRRAFPYGGTNARLAHRPDGVTVEAVAGAEWAHPWQVGCSFDRSFDDAGKESAGWRAYVRPGFVNGRDAFAFMRPGWLEGAPVAGDLLPVPLTDSPAPYLSLDDWRNPLLPSGVSASAGGEIIYQAGEGYPAFFDSLGVKPAAPGGRFAAGPFDPERTREIRAMDIVLTKPRLGSRLDVRLLSVLADAQTHELETTYQSSYYVASKGRARLSAVAKFRPLGDDSFAAPFLGVALDDGDPQLDEVKIATVYVVSPPGAGAESLPDETWQPFARHDVFWNLWHGSRYTPPPAPSPPIRFVSGLALGILDSLASALLAPINSGFDEVRNFLTNANMRGKFWTG